MTSTRGWARPPTTPSPGSRKTRRRCRWSTPTAKPRRRILPDRTSGSPPKPPAANWTTRGPPPADGDWSLLLASDGTKPAPSSISMTFPNDTSTPWAVPLMVIGGLLILAGAALARPLPKGRTPGRRRFRRRRGKPVRQAGPRQGRRAKASAKSGHRCPARGSACWSRCPRPLFSPVPAWQPRPARRRAAATAPPPVRLASGRRSTGRRRSPVLLDAQFRRILEQVCQRHRRRRRRQGRQETCRPRCRNGT